MTVDPFVTPTCDWSTVCREWPGFVLERIEYRGAVREMVTVCEVHLPYAQAKGFHQCAIRHDG